MSENELTDLQQAIIGYDTATAVKLAQARLDAGVDPTKVIEEELRPALAIVSDKFEKHEYFLPHLILCGETMKAAAEVLTSKISKDQVMQGTIVIGTVAGDIHDIGKNIVTAFLESSGFDVHDMGTEVPPLKFIDKAHEVKADIIAASALMSQTMPVQRDLLTILTERGLREQYKVMVGGAPTTAQWAEEIGADGWGEEVGDAVQKAKELVGAD
jgi:trimethylamine corrinoid protein